MRYFGLIFCLITISVNAFSPYYSGGRAARWDFNATDYEPTVFNTASKAIRFHIGNTPSVANRTAELNAVRASFAQWQAISGTTLKFEEAGFASAQLDDINLGDGTNSVFWTTRSTVGGQPFGNRAAYTLVALDAENRIIEADIALNAGVFAWFTDFSNTNSGAQFIESLLIHEIGHFLGLDHTPVGGACIIDGGPGVGPSAGLSSDEIVAARFLYPASSTPSQVGMISGTVRMNGLGIRGAIVTAETATGTICATPTDSSGNYSLPALPPGAYSVHVSPLDPDTAPSNGSLFRPKDIAIDFGSAVTAFKATDNSTANVVAGETTALNFNVTSGQPAFRIQQISKPALFSNTPSALRYAVGVQPGQTMYVGVVGGGFPSDATLSITGDGLTIGPSIYEPNPPFGMGMRVIQVQVTVATNATPGLRTFVVRRGSDVAYANGYLEVFAKEPDYNFDGLDDRFQRRYFPLFTSAEAGPTADPDNDRFSNAFEASTGSNPVDAQSFNFQLGSVDLAHAAKIVSWKSDIGKQYQLYGKEDVVGATWQTIGSPVTATTNLTSQADSGGEKGVKFYKLRLLP